MYRINWFKGNLIVLNEEGSFKDIKPVFHEELNFLRFNSKYFYPESSHPILWSIGNEYFYDSKPIAKVKWGGFYSNFRAVFNETNVSFKPIDLKALLELNREKIENISQRTMDLIQEIFSEHGKDFDIIVVAFSGGKDSLVVLDLVQRVIPPDEFVVIFSDTTMELRENLEYVKKIESFYNKLTFYTVRSEKDYRQTWREFGPPSRVHRWCCSVHKSAPVVKFARELTGKFNPRILVIDGVRSSEGNSRSFLPTISAGKYVLQKNFHPILDWSSAEVYLYIFSRNLPFNPLYRLGLRRVGCVVCPLASKRRESVLGKFYMGEISPFLKIIKDFALKNGVRKEEVEDYIGSGDWKARVNSRSKPEVLISDGKISIKAGRKGYLIEWAKILKTSLEATLKDGYVEIERNDPRIQKIANKAAYCVNCGVCEAICPTEAIQMNGDSLMLHSDRCIHCFECVDFNPSGCLRADSLKSPRKGGKNIVRGRSYSIYKTFGLRKKWLDEFFREYPNWFKENELGPVQFSAMKLWLIDAGILENNTLTQLGEELSKLGAQSPFTWGVIWTNLYRNSNLVNWYVEELEWGKYYTRKEMIDRMDERYSTATRKNGLQSLMEMFENSPLGYEMKLGNVVRKKGRREGIEKLGCQNNCKTPEMTFVFLYSLYDFASHSGRWKFTLSEIFKPDVNGGPWKLFGVGADSLKKILRGLKERLGKSWIDVEFVADLENVYLNPERTLLDVVKEYARVGKL